MKTKELMDMFSVLGLEEVSHKIKIPFSINGEILYNTFYVRESIFEKALYKDQYITDSITLAILNRFNLFKINEKAQIIINSENELDYLLDSILDDYTFKKFTNRSPNNNFVCYYELDNSIVLCNMDIIDEIVIMNPTNTEKELLDRYNDIIKIYKIKIIYNCII